MADILLFDWRLDKAIENEPTARFTPRFIVIPQIPMRVMLDAKPDTQAMLGKDPLLQQMLVDECKNAFTAALPRIVPLVRAFDEECGKTGRDIEKYAAARKRLVQQIDPAIEEARKNAVKAIDKRWVSVQQQKKEYKSYRFSVGVKVAKGIGGLVGAGVGLAGAVPTGGATLVLSVIGAYHALVEGGKTLWDCIQDAEKVQKKVESGLKSLKGTYEKSQAKGIAREVASSTVNAIFKTSATNVSTLENDNKLWRGKLTHLRYLAHYLSTELNTLLENASKLSAQLAAEKAPEKIRKSLEKVELDVEKLLTDGFVIVSMGRRVQIQKSHQDAEKGLAAQQEVTQAIEALKAGRSGAVDLFDKAIALVVDVSLSGAGMAAQAPSSAMDFAGVGKDGASTVVALNEIVVDAVPKVKAVEDGIKKKISDIVKGKLVEAPRGV
jgi:enoyl-CoA hydratase/carnithine racemase